MVTYEIAKLRTFNNIQRWLTELREHADPNIVVMLVGNKSDLKHLRAVNVEDAEDFAKQNDMLFIETSALEATNVETAFTDTIKKVHKIQLEKIRSQVGNAEAPIVVQNIENLNKQPAQPSNPCCNQ